MYTPDICAPAHKSGQHWAFLISYREPGERESTLTFPFACTRTPNYEEDGTYYGPCCPRFTAAIVLHRVVPEKLR